MRIFSGAMPVTSAPRSSVQGSTDSRYSSKPLVARSMNVRFSRLASRISRATAFDSAMSEPTSIPSQWWAHFAELDRRGSITKSSAPFRTPFRRWWKKIGWVSRAFDPHRRMTSVSSISW